MNEDLNQEEFDEVLKKSTILWVMFVFNSNYCKCIIRASRVGTRFLVSCFMGYFFVVDDFQLLRVPN